MIGIESFLRLAAVTMTKMVKNGLGSHRSATEGDGYETDESEFDENK